MVQPPSKNSGNVVALRIDDRLTREGVNQISKALEKRIAESGRLRLLIELEGFRNMDPDLLLEKLSFAKVYSPDIERMAIVSNRVWIKSWVKLAGLFFHHQSELEYFDRSEIQAAWHWISE
jgi:hypothetical protein